MFFITNTGNTIDSKSYTNFNLLKVIDEITIKIEAHNGHSLINYEVVAYKINFYSEILYFQNKSIENIKRVLDIANYDVN